jgi:hypothetical protein
MYYVNILCKTYVLITARTAGAENEKGSIYALLPNQYQFLPFAVETIGPFGEDAFIFVRKLGGRFCSATGEPQKTAWLTQRISLSIQRGNATSVVATIPPSP